MRIDEIRSQYADWLSTYAWSFFVTLTFKERDKRWNPDRSRMALGMHPEEAHKRFSQMMHHLNRFQFGKWYHKHPDRGVKWVLAQEFHKSGRVHFHALMGDDLDFTGVLGESASDAEEAKERFINEGRSVWDHNGFSRWDRIRNKQKAAAAYVSKYVTKDGLLTISPTMERSDFPSSAEG